MAKISRTLTNEIFAGSFAKNVLLGAVALYALEVCSPNPQTPQVANGASA